MPEPPLEGDAAIFRAGFLTALSHADCDDLLDAAAGFADLGEVVGYAGHLIG